MSKSLSSNCNARREPLEKTLDFRNPNESLGRLAISFMVFGKSSTASKPGNTSFDDPSSRKDPELLQIARSHHDLDPCAQFRRSPVGKVRSTIPAIAPDAGEPIPPSDLRAKDQFCPGNIRDIRRMADYRKQIAQGIDEEVPFATGHLFSPRQSHGLHLLRSFSRSDYR